MAQITTKTSNYEDADFVSHLQRRYGVSAYELGECLTHYRPSKPYSIVLGSEPSSGQNGVDSVRG